MRKSSTSKSRNLNSKPLSIDLKPFYNFQSSSDSEEKLLKFGNNRKAKYDRTKNQNADDPTDLYYCKSTTTTKYRYENDDYYSDKSYEDVEYGKYENPNIRKVSTNLNHRHSRHHQNRRHHSHQQRSHSNQNYINTNDFNEAFSKSRSQKNDKKDDFSFLNHQKEIENGFDNNFNYQKIPYNSDSVNDFEPITPSFEDIYHFSCKQVNGEENLQIEEENLQNKNDNLRFKDENIKYKKKQEDHVFNYYPETVLKTKMVFHDSDQIDDSLNNFIEEEEYYDNKRSRKGHHHHHHHQKGSHHRKTRERSTASIEKNSAYNVQKRKPLNQYYQKYLSKNKNEEIDSNFADENQIEKNKFSEYSIFDFSEKSPPSTKLCQQNNSPPNATISFSNGRNNNSNMKFVQSEEISSGKVNDYLGSSDGQEITENQRQSISDLDLNEDIDLKITFKDAIEGNKEKVHKFSIYSLKDGQNYEKNEIEEEEVEIIKDDSEKIKDESKIQYETQMQQSNENKKSNVTSPNKKTNNSPMKNRNSKNSPTSKSNNNNRNSSPNTISNASNRNNISNTKSNNNNRNSSPSTISNASNRNNISNTKSNITNSNNNSNSKSNNRNSSPNTKSNITNSNNNSNSKSNNRNSSPNTKSNITNSNYNSNSKSNNRNSSPNSKSNIGNRNNGQISKNALNNSKSSPKNKKYGNNKYEIGIEEEEEDNDVASFCDVSTSFDSQNQFDYNENKKFGEDYNADNEEKKYKTAEINVTLKDIKDAIGDKSVKKRKRKQANDPTIVTTHRRRIKRSLYRKKLVNKSVQTLEVDNPTMTLAMIQPL